MKRLFLIGLCAILTCLTLAMPASAVACTHAPGSLLRPGMAAVVGPNVDRLNVRALPAVETGVRAQLYRGAALNVIDGPSCNGGYNWWHVELADGTRGWVAEGTWNVYYVIPASMTRPPLPFEWTCAPRLQRWCILP
ncbi:MAG: SH3 domain-containing protein [Anaerolineae bacterium]|nr:SH3 domain-containing protein [Anaerolineae bacterium]